MLVVLQHDYIRFFIESFICASKARISVNPTIHDLHKSIFLIYAISEYPETEKVQNLINLTKKKYKKGQYVQLIFLTVNYDLKFEGITYFNWNSGGNFLDYIRSLDLKDLMINCTYEYKLSCIGVTKSKYLLKYIQSTKYIYLPYEKKKTYLETVYNYYICKENSVDTVLNLSLILDTKKIAALIIKLKNNWWQDPKIFNLLALFNGKVNYFTDNFPKHNNSEFYKSNLHIPLITSFYTNYMIVKDYIKQISNREFVAITQNMYEEEPSTDPKSTIIYKLFMTGRLEFKKDVWDRCSKYPEGFDIIKMFN
jgi:hypothetical protein